MSRSKQEPPTGASCATCGTLLVGPICHRCGQRSIDERWSVSRLLRQFVRLLTDVEYGFLYTAKQLFVAPGRLVTGYWTGRTVRCSNPFRYLLAWTAVNLLVNFGLGIDDLLQDQLEPRLLEQEFGAERLEAADQRFDRWLNALILLVLPIRSLVTWWCFRSGGHRYAEHLILHAFVMGQQALISTFAQTAVLLDPELVMAYLGFSFVVGLVYDAYVLRTTFARSWGRTLLGALAVGVGGATAYFTLVAGASALALAIADAS